MPEQQASGQAAAEVVCRHRRSHCHNHGVGDCLLDVLASRGLYAFAVPVLGSTASHVLLRALSVVGVDTDLSMDLPLSSRVFSANFSISSFVTTRSTIT